MDPEVQDNDVYGLIGGLCKSLLRRYQPPSDSPYSSHQDNDRLLRRLKSKAYEILLNKSSQDHGINSTPCDPIIELLKYVYVLKVGAGRISQAAELQRYLDEFIDAGLEPDSVTYSVLQLLNSLKSVDFEGENDTSLDIFHYGKPHPQLPEMLYDQGSVPPFQVYPIEAFYLPKKFETMLKKEGSIIKYNATEPGSKLTLLDRFASSSKSRLQNNRYNNNIISRISDISKSPKKFGNGTDLTSSSYFIPQIKDIERSEEHFQMCKEGIVTEPESPWQCRTLEWFIENGLVVHHDETKICEIEENGTEEQIKNLDRIWEDMDKLSTLSDHRTWETLGTLEPPKEPPFASESIDATLHLINVAEGSSLHDHMTTIQSNSEVPDKQFISNIKLLLLGVESDTFVYSSSNGFTLKKNTTIQGISTETLENLCYEVTLWGTCYRNLSDLITPDSQTGKLQIEGLIFKALCGSIKEFLLFYHAAILQVSTSEYGNQGLLKFLSKVRPLGKLIFKVAQLCCCNSQKEASLGEGICILTHIYKEVTKVTETNVALVFYSILKDCCEVYFRFLQHWIFEGVYADIYDEFMIKVRPHYLRTQGHRFWTRAFSINKNSVPGFLSDLTDSILQCGKAVTLLKICDPQNPLCRLSAANQPPVRVCLSVGMLRKQAKFYEEYTAKGLIEQGEEVSLYSAIQEQKEIEKRRADLVIAAQQDTLLRIKQEREDDLKKVLKQKSDLLEQLKDQVQEAALRKEKDREAELQADKLLLENIMKQDEEHKNNEKVERENTIKYYSELAEEAERRRIHADWRIRRMKLFDERVIAISSMRREFVSTPDESGTPVNFKDKLEELKAIDKASIEGITFDQCQEKESGITETDTVTQDNANIDNIGISELLVDNKSTTEEILSEDENKNPTSEKSNGSPSKNTSINSVEEQNQNVAVLDQINQNINVEQSSTKAVRPNVLDISRTNNQKSNRLDNMSNTHKTAVDQTALSLLNLKETDNMTDAQRNKLKVLQCEYGVTPNNNQSAMILMAMDSNEKQTELTQIQLNRLRNTQHFAHLNWENIETDNNLEQRLIGEQLDNDKTEIQLNRLRNTQHLTNLNWSVTEAENYHLNNKDRTTEVKTELELNRLRNTQVLTLLNENDVDKRDTLEKKPLTEAQLNRQKVMSHFYNRMEELEYIPVRSESLTDWQKNRNRNMAHNTDQFDFGTIKQSESEQFRETPMSTSTDHFTVSTHSSLLQVQSCGNTPYSEISNPSDMLFARSSDGLSSDGTSQSRGAKHFQDVPTFPNFIGFGSAATTPAGDNQELTAADVDLIDITSLQVYLEKSVIIPLTVQSRLVNNALMKYLLNEHKILPHLHSLRSYFFLLNGEFAKTLMQSLFTRLYEVSSPLELFNSSTLTKFLEKALVSSLSNTYTNSELLSLSATEIPTYLQTSNPEILSCLSLNYKISWPVNIIFNDVVMQQYSKVFKFLLMVGRVLWVLQEDFQILKVQRKDSISKNHHKLQLYRHSMMQFMNALHTYLTCSVLHASWSEFEKALENATTLDDVYNTHVSYIKKILSRCMLNVRGEKMRTCLCNIFKVVLKFHNRIRSQNWSEPNSRSAGPNYDNLERMYVAFCEQRAYLAHVAEILANSGYQPHLMQFLHALNINDRYSLTAKP